MKEDKPKLELVKFTGDWEDPPGLSARPRIMRGEVRWMPIVIIKDKRKRVRSMFR